MQGTGSTEYVDRSLHLVSGCHLHGWMYGGYFGHTILDEDGFFMHSHLMNSPGGTDDQKEQGLKKTDVHTLLSRFEP